MNTALNNAWNQVAGFGGEPALIDAVFKFLAEQRPEFMTSRHALNTIQKTAKKWADFAVKSQSKSGDNGEPAQKPVIEEQKPMPIPPKTSKIEEITDDRDESGPEEPPTRGPAPIVSRIMLPLGDVQFY